MGNKSGLLRRYEQNGMKSNLADARDIGLQ